MNKTVKDQMNQEVTLPVAPKRIVSLVPSQTELLFALGLREEIVGVTNYCIHPAEEVKQKTKVGGTKNFKVEAIQRLNPDLIIGNKEENEEIGINTLKKFFPVWMSDIFSLEDAIDMILRIGALVEKEPEAESIVLNIQRGFSALPQAIQPPKTVAYFIWRKPYMVAASDTFINDILKRAGFQNVFGALNRYPEITPEQLKQAQPDYIFLSSEPYPFKDKHLQEFRNICPDATILGVDGELFSWYGSRLEASAAYFAKLGQLG